MAMERLSYILRQTGIPEDEAIAEGIDAFRKIRGRDIPITAYLGLEELHTPFIRRTVRKLGTLYEQTAESIREKILLGEFPTGSKLPSEAELLKQYSSISRGTLREAMRMLAQEGLIERRQGTGSFVLYQQRRPISSPSEYREDFTAK